MTRIQSNKQGKIEPILSSMLKKDIPLIDLRSADEFKKGAFPTSCNLPILNDEERKQVGLTYKKHGSQAAEELGYKLVSGDIRDVNFCKSITKDIEVVFHLAALIGIPYSYISPLAYIRTNIEGTYNVLESAKLQGTDQVITTSTSETYGTAQYVPIDEAHPLVGQSPYAATKISADQIAFSYFSYCSFSLLGTRMTKSPGRVYCLLLFPRAPL